MTVLESQYLEPIQPLTCELCGEVEPKLNYTTVFGLHCNKCAYMLQEMRTLKSGQVEYDGLGLAPASLNQFGKVLTNCPDMNTLGFFLAIAEEIAFASYLTIAREIGPRRKIMR